MKAIIVAAGRGSRLMPLTKDTPKSMLTLKGKPILIRNIETLQDYGLDVVIVTGFASDKIIARIPKTIRHYYNDKFCENNILQSLFYASNEMDKGFIFSYSDIVYDNNILRKLLASTYDISVVVDSNWESKYIDRKSHYESESEKVVLSNDKVIKIGKHLQVENCNGEFIGLAKFSDYGKQFLKRTFYDVKSQYKPGTPFQQSSSFENAYLTDILQEIIDRNFPINAVLINGGWCEIDTLEDYIKAGGDLIP